MKSVGIIGAERHDWVGKKGYFSITMKKTNNKVLNFEGKYFKEKLQLHKNAEILGTFANTNEPAVIKNQYGKGKAILSAIPLVSSYLESPDNPVNRLLIKLAWEAGITTDARFISTNENFLNLKAHTLNNMFIVCLINDEELAKSKTLEVNIWNKVVKQAKTFLLEIPILLSKKTRLFLFR